MVHRPRVSARSLLLLAALLLPAACGESGPARASLSVADALTGDTAGFARADRPRSFAFPEDHGPHPAFRIEWWYFTGNLESGGRPFGYQLTFFRSAFRPDSSTIRSDWAARQAYMAHFAVTDVAAERFHAFERFDRGALGLAGSSGAPMRVWVGEWEASYESSSRSRSSSSSTSRSSSRSSSGGPPTSRLDGDLGARQTKVTDSLPVFHLRAEEGGVAIDLTLRALKPVVLQGGGGLSRKGPEPGNASYYYSLTRLETSGTLTVGDGTYAVSGLSWLDREWSTSALSPGLAGWDWFALQLDDGTELMVYRLRTEEGGTAPFSAGTFVEASGRPVRLSVDDFVLEATGTWRSPRGGRYPSGWRVRVPSQGLDLRVTPQLPAQELDLSFRYWEGAVEVEGEREGSSVAGTGYVELTGYADEPRQ